MNPAVLDHIRRHPDSGVQSLLVAFPAMGERRIRRDLFAAFRRGLLTRQRDRIGAYVYRVPGQVALPLTTRAAILAVLDRPMTTAEIAAAARIPDASVCRTLATMRAARLVTSTRIPAPSGKKFLWTTATCP